MMNPVPVTCAAHSPTMVVRSSSVRTKPGEKAMVSNFIISDNEMNAKISVPWFTIRSSISEVNSFRETRT